jgi:hypothetical protein
MKKLILILFLLLFSSHWISAQQYSIPNMDIKLIEGVDTLNNAWAGGIDAPIVSEIDANMDGLKDIFMFDRANDRISVFLNNGSTTGKAYHYDYTFADKFPPINAWVLLYDYDCDGQEDLFTLAPCNCGIAIYKNISTVGGGLQFTLVTSELLETYLSSTINVYATGLAVPAFADIDGDGDMDILGYNSIADGRIQYHKNYSMENWGVCDSLNFHFESGTWGFFKLQIGGTNIVNCYSCRTPGGGNDTVVTAQYGPGNYEAQYTQSTAAVRDDSNTSVYAIDLDGDGDKEVLIGDISASNTLMVCNGGTPANALMDSLCTDTIFPSYDTPVRLRSFSYHMYMDVDNDGIKDLLVTPQRTENERCVWFYKNMGTNSVPDFHLITKRFLQDEMMDVGEGASPVFFDYNADGLPDMVVGNYGEYNPANGQFKRELALYRNSGTPTQAEFTLVTKDYAGINSLNLDGPLYPAFGDLNSDGIDDMVLGCGDGKLYYFVGSGNPISYTLTSANYFGIDVGNASTPQLVDLTNDGKLDLIIGEQSGFLNFYQNMGTITAPIFTGTPTIDTLGGINVRTPLYTDGYSVPFVYYDNGKYNLWVSCMQGEVYEYRDITNNLYGTFPVYDTIIHKEYGERYSYNLAASGTYLDSDAIIDMGLGIYNGGVRLFTSIVPTFVANVQDATPKAFTLYPNPAKDMLTVKVNGSAMKLPLTADIYNNLGQKITSLKITGKTQMLDVSSYSNGIYFIKLVSSSQVVTQKFFVSHN